MLINIRQDTVNTAVFLLTYTPQCNIDRMFIYYDHVHHKIAPRMLHTNNTTENMYDRLRRTPGITTLGVNISWHEYLQLVYFVPGIYATHRDVPSHFYTTINKDVMSNLEKFYTLSSTNSTPLVEGDHVLFYLIHFYCAYNDKTDHVPMIEDFLSAARADKIDMLIG
jgi:hypothetical protein